jgi:alkanesulfonate monooxygenase SsuD/methylene tetrahydromethanopterin reductase-like flavin-dependent oxidoreductase (luciferase family)
VLQAIAEVKVGKTFCLSLPLDYPGGAIQSPTYDDALDGTVLVGSPEAVSDKLHGLQAQLGLDGVLMELNCGGMIPHAQVKSALRLLCQKVMPRFH